MGFAAALRRGGFVLALGVVALWGIGAQALDNNLARTPPMGWNSWNKFGCNVSESLIKAMADAMVHTGMKDAGYQYIVIDDCWQVRRDDQGNIVADPERFPAGMKALADYVHSIGLKFGLYSDAGDYTCQRRPGSRGHELQDAKQYAAWGVDYLKYDWCFTRGQNAPEAYTTMRDALAASGRAIVFSICEWGASQPWNWAPAAGNLWRTTGDIVDCFDCKAPLGPPGPPPGPPVAMGNGFVYILDMQDGLEKYAGPGHWNDPDMLEVGNGGMNAAEYRAHFSLWALLAAPLIAGNDLRSMGPEIQTILTNREVIAIDQDAAGVQGKRVKRDGDLDVWAKTLADGGRAVALLNRGTSPAPMSVGWQELGLDAKAAVSVRDLWQKRDLGHRRGRFSGKVPGHSVLFLRLGAATK